MQGSTRASSRLPTALALLALLAAVLLLPALGAGPARAADCRLEPDCTAADRQRLQARIDSTLAHYNASFPEIEFIQLGQPGELPAEMNALERLLGYQPISLDYEHPADVAEELLYLSVERIVNMSLEGLPSATLFKTGEQAASKRGEVCVITLDPCAIAGSDTQATHFMFSLPGGSICKIAPAYRLDAGRYLQTVLDHELFHCLDSHFNGPQPMSGEDYWDRYWHYRNENGADAYAIALQLARSPANRPYAENYARLRGLSLLDSDPCHFSYFSLQHVLDTEADALAGYSERQLVELAAGIRTRVVPDYPAFLRFWMTSFAVMQELGVEADAYAIPPPPSAIEKGLDPELQAELLDITRRQYQPLFPGKAP